MVVEQLAYLLRDQQAQLIAFESSQGIGSLACRVLVSSQSTLPRVSMVLSRTSLVRFPRQTIVHVETTIDGHHQHRVLGVWDWLLNLHQFNALPRGRPCP